MPHARRHGTAEADQSPQGRQPVWAEAPHQGLANSQFWAFYHPLEVPQLPIRFHLCNRTELTLLATIGKNFHTIRPHCRTESTRTPTGTREGRANTHQAWSEREM